MLYPYSLILFPNDPHPLGRSSSPPRRVQVARGAALRRGRAQEPRQGAEDRAPGDAGAAANGGPGARHGNGENMGRKIGISPGKMVRFGER